jgi:hypothetical protein
VNLSPGRVAAWLLLAAVAFVTLAPIGWRPETGASANIERFAAFAAIGLAFGLAYPRQLWLVAVVVLGTAVALEILQLVAVTRHAGLRDLIAKLAGGTSGIIAGWVIAAARRQFAAAGGQG